MKTRNDIKEQNLHIAESYYSAMLSKDFETMSSYLYDEIHFIGPLDEMHGKEAVVSAAKNLTKILDEIKIRSKFASGNQIMLAYDFLFSKLDLNLRSAVLMDLKNGLISKIELFYDASPFQHMKEEIFNQ